MSKVLVVDDDPSLLKIVESYLHDHSFDVATADNGAQALTRVRDEKPDLVLSDADMPILNGHTLCQILRKETSARVVPLILMSGSLVEEDNILAGFERGADDYILKPFSLPILLARIKAVIRRYENAVQTTRKLEKHGIVLDPEGRSVKVKGETIVLTRKEFDLLGQLMGQTGRVLSVAYLLENVWGYEPSAYNDSGTVETHVSHLRKKLGPELAKRIVNLTGHGYKFDDF